MNNDERIIVDIGEPIVTPSAARWHNPHDSTIEIECSEWLKDKCREMWDIHNTRSYELEKYATELSERRTISEQRQYVKDNWDRKKMLEYHMGNIFSDTNGALKWAMERKSKIAMLKYILENGIGALNLHMANKDLNHMLEIINCDDGLDGARWIMIREEYSYWGNLDNDELFSI